MQIKTAFKVLSILILSALMPLQTQATTDACIKIAPESTTEELNNCWKESSASKKVIFNRGSQLDIMKTQTKTIGLGLSEPIVPSLKKARDKFIDNYLNKNITKLEELKANNMRRFNLRNIYGGSPVANDTTLSALKAVFGFSDISEVLDAMKEQRLAKCTKQKEEKIKSCDVITNPDQNKLLQQVSQCKEDANDIVENCFGLEMGIGPFNKIQDMFSDWEDDINSRIDELTIVNQESVQSAISQIKSKTQKFDSSIEKLNEAMNLSSNLFLPDFLERDSTELVESFWGSKLNVGASAIGSGTYSAKNSEPLLSFKSSSSISNRENNLCELAKCIAWPDNKMKGNAEYKKSCVDLGYTKPALNGKINEARVALMQKMAVYILKEIMIMLPVHEYMKMIKTKFMCSVAATVQVEKSKTEGSVVDAASGLLDSLSSMVSDADMAAAAAGGASETVRKCLTDSTQSLDRTNKDVSAHAQKSTGTLQSYLAGLITYTVNIPLVTFGMKANVEQDATAKMTADANIESCVKQGKTKEWIDAYDECKVDSDIFNLTVDINPEIPKLFLSIRDWKVQSCQQSKVNPSGETLTVGTLENDDRFRLPEDVASEIKSFKDNVRFAKREMKRLKVDFTNFTPTSEGYCIESIFNALRSRQRFINIKTCRILDQDIHTTEEVITTSNLKSDDFGLIVKSCNGAANFVYDYMVPLKKLPTNDINDPAYDSLTDLFLPNVSPKNTTKPFAIARAISITNTCDRLINIYYQHPPTPSQLKDLTIIENENILHEKVILGYGVDPQINQIFNIALSGMEARPFTEKFNICIKSPLPKPSKDSVAEQQIFNATSRYCRDFRVMLFDRYYDDAAQAFNHPLVTPEDRKKVDDFIIRSSKFYKDGKYE